MALALNTDQVQGFVTPPPHTRLVKVVFSPQLQTEVNALAAGSTELAPGKRSAMHQHHESEELWLVVAGEGEATIGDERVAVRSDTLILIPRSVEHQIANLGEVPMKVYWVFIPPGPERATLEQRLV